MIARIGLAALLLLAGTGAPAFAQTAPAVTYRVSFPAPEHHWLEVDVVFPALGSTPLRARMSRSSPGRYAIHEFAKNVFAFNAFDGQGRPLKATRPDADEWLVSGHDGSVRVVYRLFGDHADGTYMGVDTTHAHLNMPATFMWAPGLEMRPIDITFVPAPKSPWKVATQLYPTSSPFRFTAPNLQYFMDSPTELSDFVLSTFRVDTSTFRVAVHGDGSQSDVDAYAKSIERIVREERAVFGEFPEFEPGYYTFLLDLVSWAEGDAMEHRNSTYISIPGLSLRTPQGRARLDAVAHEFFHVWNVERIRSVGLEPFDFTRQNVTCCLWLGEGFTQYYEGLFLARAGFAGGISLSYASTVMNLSARTVRSAVEMSEHGPFEDGAVANDVNDRGRTYISYYTFGAALALALDFSLREMSGGKLSLDDYMRRLWQNFGRPPDKRPGYVARPYTVADLRAELASLTGNRPFADEFFDRYIEGRDVANYARLLDLAGFVVRPFAPERGWIGSVGVEEDAGGLLVGGSGPPESRALPQFGSPVYDAGLDAGDDITSIDGRPATSAAWIAIGQKKPGETVTFAVRRRGGASFTAAVPVKADPRVQIVQLESTGGTLTAAQRAFRQAWLGSKVQ